MRIVNTSVKNVQTKLDKEAQVLAARTNEERLNSLFAEMKRANRRLEASKHAVECDQSSVDALQQAIDALVGEV
jgi:predicted  nucleic acid-binding Zn-ribbon protein